VLSRNTKKKTLEIIDSGVYILILEGVIVYVGESMSVYSRIGAHVKDTKKRFDTVRILPCLEHRRRYWEAILIDRYQPIFNSKGKDKATNKRHIFELSQIRKGQQKRVQKCDNCKQNESGIVNFTQGGTMSLGINNVFSSAPTTTAVTSAGQVTLETVPASNDVYVQLAQEEELELKRHKKEVAWDDSVGYVEKLNNSLDVSFKLSNPYSNQYSILGHRFSKKSK